MNYKILTLSMLFSCSLINTTQIQQDKVLLLEQAKEIITDQIKDMNTPASLDDCKGLQAIMAAYGNSIMNPTEEHGIIFANIVATMYNQCNDPLLQIIKKGIELQSSSDSFINKLEALTINTKWLASKKEHGIASTEAKNVLLSLINDALDEEFATSKNHIEETMENSLKDEEGMLIALDRLFEEYKTYHEQYMRLNASQYSTKIQNLSLYQFHRLFSVHYDENNQSNISADDSKLNDIKYDITNLFFEFLAAPMLKDTLHKLVQKIDYELIQLKNVQQ